MISLKSSLNFYANEDKIFGRTNLCLSFALIRGQSFPLYKFIQLVRPRSESYEPPKNDPCC